MNDHSLQTLQEALDLKQKELDLIMAIDEIRDTVFEPDAMLASIVNLLAEWFAADLCLLFLRDRETGQVELRAANEGDRKFDRLRYHITHRLAEQARPSGAKRLRAFREGTLIGRFQLSH